MKKVALTSIASCFFLYFVASVFGYMTFYNYVQSDLLLTYNHSDPRNALTLIVRVCVLIGVMLTLPLTHYPVSNKRLYFSSKILITSQGTKSCKLFALPSSRLCMETSHWNYVLFVDTLRYSCHCCSRYQRNFRLCR